MCADSVRSQLALSIYQHMLQFLFQFTEVLVETLKERLLNFLQFVVAFLEDRLLTRWTAEQVQVALAAGDIAQFEDVCRVTQIAAALVAGGLL